VLFLQCDKDVREQGNLHFINEASKSERVGPRLLVSCSGSLFSLYFQRVSTLAMVWLSATGHPRYWDQNMTAENFDRILQALAQRQPFQVFAVELHGGHRFEVDHPRALVVRDGVAVFLAPGGVPIWFDHTSVNQFVGAPANTQD
jgi:hypothetical protein